MDVIILVGGLGTRLKSVVNNVPKPMAPIGDKPFLKHILDFLIKYPIKNIIMAVGYKSEIIINEFGDNYMGIPIKYSIEDKPLGTGGAILNAFNLITTDNVLVLNGDTYFNIELNSFIDFFNAKKNIDILISLKEMKNFDRYGSVSLNEKKQIISFQEKKFIEKGFINGGIYLVNKMLFDNISMKSGDSFSFEKDFLESNINNIDIYGLEDKAYFIDIGIPEDYYKAEEYIKLIN